MDQTKDNATVIALAKVITDSLFRARASYYGGHDEVARDVLTFMRENPEYGPWQFCHYSDFMGSGIAEYEYTTPTLVLPSLPVQRPLPSSASIMERMKKYDALRRDGDNREANQLARDIQLDIEYLAEVAWSTVE